MTNNKNKHFKAISKNFEALQDGQTFDVIVIGSGYGGAISAARLAAATDNKTGQRLKVALIERGREILPGDYPNTIMTAAEEMQIRTDSRPDDRIGNAKGLFDLRINEDVSALVGCGLGGTSLINANVALEIEPNIVDDDWPEVFKKKDGREETINKILAPYYYRARHALGSTPYPFPEKVPKENGECESNCHPVRKDQQQYKDLNKYQALKKSGDALGAKTYAPPINVSFHTGKNAFGFEQIACNNCGDCCSGCNVGAKNTTLMNYLPSAHRSGAFIYCETSVHHVQQGDDDWIVHTYATDRSDKNCCNTTRKTIKAKHVILAAGTLGSSEIMLRSKREGLDVSEMLGKRFSGNGDVLAFGYNNYWKKNEFGLLDMQKPAEEDTYESVYAIGQGTNELTEKQMPGPCITGVIDMRDTKERENALVVEEGVIPGALSAVIPMGFMFAAVEQANFFKFGYAQGANRLKEFAALAETAMSNPGSMSAECYRGPISRTQTYLVMSVDDSSGEIVLGKNTDHAVINWPNAGRSKTIERDNNILKMVSDAVEGQYLTNPIWNEAYGKKIITVHPLGGCQMGDTVEKGVVNDRGQVFKPDGDVYQGLMISDGSIIPGAVGVNPLLTISALTERNCELLAEREGWTIEYTESTPLANASDEPESVEEIRGLKSANTTSTLTSSGSLSSSQSSSKSPTKSAMAVEHSAAQKDEPSIEASPASGMMSSPVSHKSSTEEEENSEVVKPNHLVNAIHQHAPAMSASSDSMTIEELNDQTDSNWFEGVNVIAMFSEVSLLRHRAKKQLAKVEEEGGSGPAYEQRLADAKTKVESLDSTLRNMVTDLFAAYKKDFSPQFSFTETMHGYFRKAQLLDGVEQPLPLKDLSFDDLDPYDIAYASGKSNDHIIEFTLDILSENLDFMTDNPKHPAKIIGGQVRMGTKSNPEVYEVKQGRIELIYVDERHVEQWLVSYYIEFGDNFRLEGQKQLKCRANSHYWTDLTTMYVNVFRYDQLEFIGRVSLTLQDFIHQMATAKTPPRKNLLGKILKFVECKFPSIKGMIGAIYLGKLGAVMGKTIFRSYGGLVAELANFYKEDRIHYRSTTLPKPLEYICESRSSDEDFYRIRMVRYCRNIHDSTLNPVILVPGLGVNASSFATTTVDRNLVEELVDHNFDVWLFDYRGAQDSGASEIPFTIDDIARLDWPAAIRCVQENTIRNKPEPRKVQIIAHCVGSLSLQMALLKKWVKKEDIQSIIASQLTIHPVTNWLNNAKADAGVVKELEFIFKEAKFKPVVNMNSGSSNYDRAFDLIAYKIPAPPGEQCNNPVCNRIFAIYGPSYLHNQLNHNTHIALRDWFQSISLKPFEQLSKCIENGYVVDADGNNTYLSEECIRTDVGDAENKIPQLDLPITFISGALNLEFIPQTTQRTYDWLKTHNPKSAHKYHRHVFPNYGHMDCFIGKNAGDEVFPILREQLQADLE